MSKKVNWFITDQSVTVNYSGQTHIVKRNDVLANQLISAIKEGRMNDIPNLVSVAASFQKQSKGNIVVKDGELLVRGIKVPVELANKIRKFMDEGLPYQPLVKFAENLQANPSYRAVNELFKFLEKNDHPLTERGTFLAFKKVRDDYTDVHTGKFDNHPGQVLEMSRNQVDENANSHCSRGFHVGNWRYCHEFNGNSGIMLEVEVNPADVVSVPNDLDEKIRVCKYKVLGVVDKEFSTDPLRVIDPDYEDTSGDDGKDYCVECGEFDCDGECQDEEEVGTCEECGGDCDMDYDLCDDCYDGCYDDAEETQDRYPFEDELEDE